MPLKLQRTIVWLVVALAAVAIALEATSSGGVRPRIEPGRVYFEQRCTYDGDGGLHGCAPTDDELQQLCASEIDRVVRLVEIIDTGISIGRDVVDPGIECRDII